jgi:hypothetical protein
MCRLRAAERTTSLRLHRVAGWFKDALGCLGRLASVCPSALDRIAPRPTPGRAAMRIESSVTSLS